MASRIIDVLWNTGRGIMGRDNPRPRNDRAQGTDTPALVSTGIITAVREGGFGFIVRDTSSDRNDLFFNRAEVVGDGFDNLQVGQSVSFGEEPDPYDRNRRRAVDVRPTGSDVM